MKRERRSPRRELGPRVTNHWFMMGIEVGEFLIPLSETLCVACSFMHVIRCSVCSRSTERLFHSFSDSGSLYSSHFSEFSSDSEGNNIDSDCKVHQYRHSSLVL